MATPAEHAATPANRPSDAASTSDGGDDACWLDQVCDACGGFIDAGVDHVCRTPVRTTPGDAG